jgi:hypothetical protein
MNFSLLLFFAIGSWEVLLSSSTIHLKLVVAAAVGSGTFVVAVVSVVCFCSQKTMVVIFV